jgi:hypothetical protein
MNKIDKSVIDNYKIVDNEINKIQESIKKKYLNNKLYMDFLISLFDGMSDRK